MKWPAHLPLVSGGGVTNNKKKVNEMRIRFG